MTRRSIGTLCFAAATVVSATLAPLHAQATKTGPTYGVLGNVALPFGDFGDFSSLGIGGGAFIEGKPTGFPIGFRADASYNRFIGKDGSDGLNLLQFTGNAILNFPSSTGGKGAVTPVYALGGLGFYRSSGDGDSSTDVGFNLGAGYNLKSATYKPFVEARIHFVDDAEWISFGVGFRF